MAINGKCGDKISDRMKGKIVTYVSAHPFCKSTDVASHMNLQISRIKWYLARLVEEGKLITHGANRNRTYSAK